MAKIPARYTTVLFAFFMSFVMTVIMGTYLTLVNTGWIGDFGARWLRAFLFAWPVSFLAILVFAGQVRRLVNFLTVTDFTD